MTHRVSMLSCAVLTTTAALGQPLAESQVVLLYNSQNTRSLAVRNAYLAAHPGVLELDINVDYSAFPVGDSNSPNIYAINHRFATMEAYFAFIHYPLENFLLAHTDVRAIATTSGLPAALARDFSPAWHNGAPGSVATACEAEIVSSLEAAIATRSFRATACADGTFPPERQNNPYYGATTPINELLAICDGSGPLIGEGRMTGERMLIVSRLDSAAPWDPADTRSRTNAIEDLITRSQGLQLNIFATTAIVDQAACLASSSLINSIINNHDYAAFNLYAAGFPVGYDNTEIFINGEYDANQDANDAPFIEHPVSAVVTFGRNFQFLTGTGLNPPLLCPNAEASVDPEYVRYYNAHPAAVFISIESWNGWTLHSAAPGPNPHHGQSLDWIVSGPAPTGMGMSTSGSFTYGNVAEPGGAAAPNAHHVLTNFYLNGLTWGESIYSGLRYLGQYQTPIGDPLARVVVVNPDLDGDHDVDFADYSLWTTLYAIQSPAADVNQDGIIDGDDSGEILSTIGRVRPTIPAAFTPPDILPPWEYYTPSYTPTRGDLNGDGCVNDDDYQLALASQDTDCPDGDANEDGVSDVNDTLLVLMNLGMTIADVDNSGSVDGTDFILVVGLIGLTSSDPGYVARYDINLDGVIAWPDADYVAIHDGLVCN